MGNRSSVAQKSERLFGVAVVLSMLACYGVFVLVSTLALFGLTAKFHEGTWAAAVATFCWLAFFGIAINDRRAQTAGPAIPAGVGVLLVNWVMFISFSNPLEILGFAALIAACEWDRRANIVRQRRTRARTEREIRLPAGCFETLPSQISYTKKTERGKLGSTSGQKHFVNPAQKDSTFSV